MSYGDSQNTTQLIKSKINISDIIGKDIKLIRKGQTFSGLCPFHNEKSPSFSVNDQRGSYHCFGCGTGGDVFQYLMDKKNMTFLDALEHLSSITGVPIQKSNAPKQQSEPLDELYTLMGFCAAWYRDKLSITTGEKARVYLQKRGLSPETIAHFSIGYAPDSFNALYNDLKSKKFSDAAIQKSGMVIFPESGKQPYDRFRGRVMFPIFDSKHRVVAFGGRIMGDGQPKYLNSPETPLFHKGSQLYNLNMARENAHKNGLIVAEGYMDVIGLHQHGITNAIAPLGTAITEDQIQLIWRYTDCPTFCLDGDAAGRKAAFRSAERALPLLKEGRTLSFCFLPDGEDPDSLCGKNVNDFLRILDQKQPLSSFVWDNVVAQHHLKTPEDKALFKKNIRNYILKIGDENVRHFYGDDYKNRLDELFAYKPQKKYDGKTQQNDTQTGASPQLKKNSYLNYKILLAILMDHPYLISIVEEELSMVDFPETIWNDLKNFLMEHGHVEMDRLTLKRTIETSGLGSVIETLKHVKAFYPSPNDEDMDQEALKLFWLDIFEQATLQKSLNQEIQEKIKTTKKVLTPEAWEQIKHLKLKSRSLS